MALKGFGDLLNNAGKSASKFLNQTVETVVKAVDQNGDGKLDMKDVEVVTNAIGNAAQNTMNAIKDNREKSKLDAERKALSPIFRHDLRDDGFQMPKLIRITDIDKRRQESGICKGSMGFMSEYQGYKMLNLFRNEMDSDMDFCFYPTMDNGVYYADPVKPRHYIALDIYFDYLKEVRIHEIQKIVQDLGASYFKIIFREQKKSVENNNITGKLNAGRMIGSADMRHTDSSLVEEGTEIVAEMYCQGHAPVNPSPIYLKNEPSVQSLTALRMDSLSPIHHHKYAIKLSSSSGLKEQDAVKIDAVLKGCKISGNVSVAREAQKESKRILEYEVEF